MRQFLFLYYGWFFQDLEKGCILTNMHTTESDSLQNDQNKLYPADLYKNAPMI